MERASSKMTKAYLGDVLTVGTLVEQDIKSQVRDE